MLRSMTAQADACLQIKRGKVTVDMQSVNRKSLDLQLFLPRPLSFLEGEIRQWLSSVLVRGQVTLRLSMILEEGTLGRRIIPNLSLVRQLRDAWQAVAEEWQGDVAVPLPLSLLQGETGLLQYEEEPAQKEYRESVWQVIKNAMSCLIERKQREGALLQRDFEERLARMTSLLKTIEEQSIEVPNRYRERLAQHLQEAFGHLEDTNERILREVALLAEKWDISEEVVRFRCHISHFREVMASHENAVGKTLEFIVQELHREINTVGSKSSDVSIARAVIEIKSELEKIREQLQNIE